jgi:hypothetical protein
VSLKVLVERGGHKGANMLLTHRGGDVFCDCRFVTPCVVSNSCFFINCFEFVLFHQLFQIRAFSSIVSNSFVLFHQLVELLRIVFNMLADSATVPHVGQ